MPRVFSYVVAWDGGFAPNPFHGWCTLACCKPRIRKAAEPGDLVVGLSPRCELLVYILRVEETLTFDQYWTDPRFEKKKAVWSRDGVERNGDNIYEPDARGGFRQLRSAHWDHQADRESTSAKEHDTSANAVLVGRDFGGEGPELEDELSFLFVTRGHRCQFTPDQIAAAGSYFDQLPRGRKGEPTRWLEREARRHRTRQASCG